MRTTVRTLMEHKLPGAKATNRGHLARATRMEQVIALKFQVTSVYGWKVSYLRWFLHDHLCAIPASAATTYDYYRTARAIAACLGKWADWSHHLRGAWVREGIGGRKPKLPHWAKATAPLSPTKGAAISARIRAAKPKRRSRAAKRGWSVAAVGKTGSRDQAL